MNSESLKKTLDTILESLHIQPVGCGYIDCICPKENIAKFIDNMNFLGISITEFTWWCYVDNGHKPCGMGGPINRYGSGWYSEISMGISYEFADNESTRKFLLTEYPASKEYKSCFVPGFWLDVPNEWINPWSEN